MRFARASLLVVALGALPACGSVMHAYGDHAIYADGHAWHTWPARLGVAVAGNATAFVLSPIFLLGLLTGQGTMDLYVDVGTHVALGGGLLLGTPFWLVGLPFEGGDDDQSPMAGSSR